MSKLAAINALKEQARETQTNMTETTKGGGKARLLPKGHSLAYITGLIQYGNQPQSYDGQPKNPAPELALQFALLDEGFVNEDGTPYVVELYPFAESTNEKANTVKLFKALNWDNTATTWIDLIGKAIMVQIEHYKGGKDKKEDKSGIKKDGFLPPCDPRGGKPYPLPALDEDLLVAFLWDYPTLENWKALRDWHQHRCLDALNFVGSDLEGMLIENGLPTTYDKKAKKEEAADDAPGNAETPMATPDATDVPFEGGVPSDMAMPTPDEE
jgi:hypothetical protein